MFPWTRLKNVTLAKRELMLLNNALVREATKDCLVRTVTLATPDQLREST